jgi:uncharacterized protein
MPELSNLLSVRDYIERRLRDELASDLQYHCARHTLDDVYPAAERLADAIGIDGEERLILRVATLYHDLGYVEQHLDNEPVAVCIAQATLPGFGFGSAQIEQIACLILATRFPQQPTTALESIICDADLDYLGREDFERISRALHAERSAYGMPTTEAEWHRMQVEFLEGHTYWTEAARAWRDEGKRRNLERMRELVGQDEG